ncbi:hypothetical protein ENUP19_0252G0104 [Entamoeba nuttalli]|uniref:Ras guanine nucleotide exchange factor, putative n=2 Tax=Entamoeba nuttalli TaxID=412467 RepID=K2H9G8_ENTNP|nr:Ras guanine nucleotide exchange factor, putative [Entamoeba nuttalli P19]EKE39229.1 Ras guanine nucleotide exchange factor, putative [Entamoeba nuttalli P19]|eukprot:XP_008858426.1 Ras guanine nucleotide exchange factor, putative [Entamoeba nuttalli P19]
MNKPSSPPITISSLSTQQSKRITTFESIHQLEQFQSDASSLSFVDTMDESDEETQISHSYGIKNNNKIEEIKQRKISSEKKNNSDDSFLINKLKEDPTTIRKDGQICAANEDALLNEICSAPTEFMQTFMWTHTMFMSSSAMILGLVDRFEISCESDSKKAQEVRVRIMNGLRYILIECWGAISNKIEVQQIFQSFCERLEEYEMSKQADLLRSMLEKRLAGTETTYVQTIRDSPLPIPTFNCLMHLEKPLDIIDIPAIEFARQMTLIIHTAFSKIKLYEFFKWTNDKNACKSIQTLVKYYNGFQWYFQKRIVHCKTQEERLIIIKFLIDVANHCKTLNNFDSLVCIMQIFLTSPIYRLKNTISKLDNETKSKYDNLLSIVSPEHNWSILRNLINKIIQSSQIPCVPYIGIYLSDMTFISDGNLSRFENGLVNFDKCKKMCSVVRNFDKINTISYSISHYPILKHFIENIHGENQENENYEYSKLIEPLDPFTIKISENGEIIEKVIPSEKTIFEIFGNSIPVAMTNGLLENRLLNINDPVKKLQTVFGDSFLVNFNSPKKIPFVFHYDTQNVLISLPIDISLPLYHSFPLINSYMSKPFPFIPLLLDENYRISGIVNQRDRIDQTINNSLGYYLLPLNYFCSRHTKLSDDLDRFQRSYFYYRFDFKRCSEPLVIILVDHFVCIYQSGTSLRCCPVDYTHFTIVSSSRAYYYEKFPGMKMDTPFSENSPLPIDGDIESLVSLMQRLQKQSKVYSTYLIGIQPNQTHLVNGVPPLVISLMQRIYTHDNFFENNIFKQIPPTKLTMNIVDSFNNGIIKGNFNEMIALLKLYIKTSCMPFFIMVNQHDLISFSQQNDQQRMILITNWIKKIQPCLTGIFIALMRMFAAYTIINSNTNFDEWAFCISSTSNANIILQYILDHIDLLNDIKISSQYSLPNVYNDQRTFFFTNEDYAFFNDEVQYALNTPSSIINIFTKKNSQLSSFPGQTIQVTSRIDKKLFIGTNHHSNKSNEEHPSSQHPIHPLSPSKTTNYLVPNKPISSPQQNKQTPALSSTLKTTPLPHLIISSRTSDPQKGHNKTPLILDEKITEFPVTVSPRKREQQQLIGRKESLKGVIPHRIDGSHNDSIHSSNELHIDSNSLNPREEYQENSLHSSNKTEDLNDEPLENVKDNSQPDDCKISAKDSQLMKKRDPEKDKKRRAGYRAFSMVDILNSEQPN